MSVDVVVVVEHLDGKVADISFEMLGCARELARATGGRAVAVAAGHELTAVVCTSGTPRSHIGIVSREFHVPCVMAAVFDAGEPAEGTEVEVDCSGADGVVRG